MECAYVKTEKPLSFYNDGLVGLELKGSCCRQLFRGAFFVMHMNRKSQRKQDLKSLSEKRQKKSRLRAKSQRSRAAGRS